MTALRHRQICRRFVKRICPYTLRALKFVAPLGRVDVRNRLLNLFHASFKKLRKVSLRGLNHDERSFGFMHSLFGGEKSLQNAQKTVRTLTLVFDEKLPAA